MFWSFRVFEWKVLILRLDVLLCTGMEEVSLISFLKRVPLLINALFPADNERHILAATVLNVMSFEDKETCTENKRTADFFVSYIKEIELRARGIQIYKFVVRYRK